jgi:hypothetical protein
MAVLRIVVVVTLPGHGSRCAGAGAEVCVAWICGVAAVVVVLFCVRAARFGLVKGAIVAGAVDAGTANGAVRHVQEGQAVDVITAVSLLLCYAFAKVAGLIGAQLMAARHAWVAYAGHQAGLFPFTGSHGEANHS